MDLSRGISDSFFQDGNKLIFNDKIGPITKWGGNSGPPDFFIFLLDLILVSQTVKSLRNVGVLSFPANANSEPQLWESL